MTEFINDTRLDLIAVRKHLNELRFVDGARKLPIGIASDLFVDQSPAQVIHEIQRLGEQLAAHDLTLEHSPDPSSQLVVVQYLQHRPGDPNAMARAMQWVSKITTVALEMVVPVVIGTWLDNQFGTRFLAFAGLVLGVPLGIWHLIKMTKC